METETSLPYSQQPAAVPTPSHIDLVHALIPLLEDPF